MVCFAAGSAAAATAATSIYGQRMPHQAEPVAESVVVLLYNAYV
jgi:hypothetical protein